MYLINYAVPNNEHDPENEIGFHYHSQIFTTLDEAKVNAEYLRMANFPVDIMEVSILETIE